MENTSDIQAPPQFQEFQKIARLSREIVITEKIDGTNAQIYIGDNGEFMVGSRTRWITPGKSTDNYGFARWAEEHKTELLTLGPGRHYGEWWGQGIQRGYGLTEKRFSLFNIEKYGAVRPACCDIVPLLYRGPFETSEINSVLDVLKTLGSYASAGFMEPEGIVIYHAASKMLFKKTILNDESPKSLVKEN